MLTHIAKMCVTACKIRSASVLTSNTVWNCQTGCTATAAAAAINSMPEENRVQQAKFNVKHNYDRLVKKS